MTEEQRIKLEETDKQLKIKKHDEEVQKNLEYNRRKNKNLEAQILETVLSGDTFRIEGNLNDDKINQIIERNNLSIEVDGNEIKVFNN